MKTRKSATFPQARTKRHIEVHISTVLFRGRQKNCLALAPDIKGNAGAAECLYTRGLSKSQNVKTQAESLWQLCPDCHRS